MSIQTFLLIAAVSYIALGIAVLVTVLVKQWGRGWRRHSKKALVERMEDYEMRTIEHLQEISQGLRTLTKQLQGRSKKQNR